MFVTPKEAALLPLIILSLWNFKAISCEDSTASIRNKKHFSLFSVVTFKNDECASETTFNGGQVTGTCYSTTECTDKDGSASGNCASGFGVCCTFVYNGALGTAKAISENRTYIQSPNYPSVETTGAGTTTTYTISKMDTDICQVRLDFDNFVIVGPANTGENGVDAADGNCNDKLAFTLTGGAYVPTLCGVMTGQHLYMDLGMDSADTAALALSLVATTVTTTALAFRSFRVKTSQIPCWAPYRAPDGCNQYFMQLTGQIVSPNFSVDPVGTRGPNLLNSGTHLLTQNLKYCIRRELGSCCVLYQVCNQFAGVDLTTAAAGGAALTGDSGVISQGWSLHTRIDHAGIAVATALAVATNDVGLVDGACSGDYVEIPDSSTGHKTYGAAMECNTRYCGQRFGLIPAITATAGRPTHAPVWDCTEPFEATFRTDQMNDIGEVAIESALADVLRGVCLDFRQDQCN